MSAVGERSIPPAANRLIEEARSCERAGSFGPARARYERALHTLIGREFAPLASALLRWIGRAWEAEGDLAAAADCLDAAEAAAEACGSVMDLAHTLNCQGIVLFRRGRLEAARSMYERARQLAEESGELRLVAMVDQNLGNVANVHGDHTGAHDCYLRSLGQYRALGLEEFVGPLLTNIGRVHIDLEAWDNAESVFDNAETSCHNSGNVTYQVLIQVNRARLHLTRGNLQKAREACDDALRRSSALGEDRWLGEIHKYLGVILHRMGCPGPAESSYAAALLEASRREELLLTAEVRKEMACLFSEQGRHREMFACLNEAHGVFEQLRARRDLAAVSREIEALERSFEQIVNDWGDSIESTDRYTKGHCERVADHACRLAMAAGLDRRFLRWFRMGALLHDVGKLAVPGSILNKRGALTPDEWAIMKEHPAEGVRLLSGVEFPWDIRPMVMHHHERWDGGGYPHGLRGEEIPLAARVLCVADVYDALTTTRSYRTAFPRDLAFEIMAGDSGHVFDPELFSLFRSMVRHRRPRSRHAPAAWRGPLPLMGQDSMERRPPVGAVA